MITYLIIYIMNLKRDLPFLIFNIYKFKLTYLYTYFVEYSNTIKNFSIKNLLIKYVLSA